MTASTRLLLPTDRRIMERTLGAAFVDDPVWTWVMGAKRINLKRAGVATRAMSLAHLSHGPSQVTEDGNAIAVWTSPKEFRAGPKDMLPNLPAILGALGLGGTVRGASMSDLEKLHPAEPHYYLALLGTHPAHQGRGLGSAAMAPVLATADAEGTGCYLESSKEANVPFYRRHGFEVTGTYDVGKGKGPKMWLMWRDPQ